MLFFIWGGYCKFLIEWWVVAFHLSMLIFYLPTSFFYIYPLPYSKNPPPISSFPVKTLVPCSSAVYCSNAQSYAPEVPFCFPDFCSYYTLHNLIWRCGTRSLQQEGTCDIKTISIFFIYYDKHGLAENDHIVMLFCNFYFERDSFPYSEKQGPHYYHTSSAPTQLLQFQTTVLTLLPMLVFCEWNGT